MAPVIPCLLIVSFMASGLPGFSPDALFLVPTLLKFLGRLLDRIAVRYSVVIKEAWGTSAGGSGRGKDWGAGAELLVSWKPLKSENLLDQQ